jgi:DNA ligase (NAD+)
VIGDRFGGAGGVSKKVHIWRLIRFVGGVKFWLFVFTAVLLAAQPVERLHWLQTEIARHDALYFQKAEPEISDYEYDLLKAELRELEAKTALESTERVGSDLNGLRTVIPHGRPMLSLDKAYSDKGVARFLSGLWEEGVEEDELIVIEPKYDGVAINLRLVRGQMTVATTRGDGKVGQIVTEALEAVATVRYDWTEGEGDVIESIELRGEVYIANEAFAALNERRIEAGDPEFRHPRSVAAGSLNLADLEEIRARGLSLVIHGWGEVLPAEAAPKSVNAFRDWLVECGLPGTVVVERVRLSDTAELDAAVRRVREEASSFPTDGVVIKVNSVAEQERLGNGATAPRWAIARKFAPPRAESKLLKIVWQVGRTGALTPVAEFDAVQLDGTTVARASLHNAAEVVRRDLRIGDRIVVEKAGEIVPVIVEVRTEQRSAAIVPYALPETCPTCGEGLDFGGVGEELRCANTDACRDQIVLRIVHFASRNAVQISGLGKGIAAKLVEAGLVHLVSDLYLLTEAQLMEVPGIGAVSARRLMEEIEESHAAPRWRILVGMGLPGLGPAAAKKVGVRLERLTDLLNESKRTIALSELGQSARNRLESALAIPAVQEVVEALELEKMGR